MRDDPLQTKHGDNKKRVNGDGKRATIRFKLNSDNNKLVGDDRVNCTFVITGQRERESWAVHNAAARRRIMLTTIHGFFNDITSCHGLGAAEPRMNQDLCWCIG